MPKLYSGIVGTLVLWMVIGGLFMVPKKAMSKRATPPDVAPVVSRGVEYAAEYEGVGGQEAVCAVVARDPKTGQRLWKTVVYRIRYDKKMETDVQDVWPRFLSIEGKELVVTNESDERFRLNLLTGRKSSSATQKDFPKQGLIFYSGGITSSPRRLIVDLSKSLIRFGEGGNAGAPATGKLKREGQFQLTETQLERIRSLANALWTSTKDYSHMPPIADFDVSLVLIHDDKTREINSYGPPKDEVDQLYAYVWSLVPQGDR